jgi:hypothetical protein
MGDFTTRGAKDESAPLMATFNGPWAHAKKTHDETHKEFCDYCKQKLPATQRG